MARVKLTDRFVQSAPAGASGRADYFDSVTPGLSLRVSGTHKAWYLLFTSPATGKRARVGLGSYPAVTLADARGKALEAKTEVAASSDPRRTQNASAAALLTLAGLAELYVADPRKAALRSIAEVERR